VTTRSVDIEAATHEVLRSPSDSGTIELVAVRPAESERRVVEEAQVSTEAGIIGDSWLERLDGDKEISHHNQVTLMNSRFAAAITPEGQGWELAGDQLYVDFDISVDNAPPGTRLQVGSAVVQISAQPHTGCAKFVSRFGRDIWKATRTEERKELRLRGVNASVAESGVVRRGDAITKH